MFVGYADNHSGDVYRIFNENTGKILTTRDERFLKTLYGEYRKEKESADDDDTSSNDSDGYEEEMDDSGDEEENRDEGKTKLIESADDDDKRETRYNTRSQGLLKPAIKLDASNDRLCNEMKRLGVSWEPSTFTDIVDICLVGGTDDEYVNPVTFQDAWNHPDLTERKKWREDIKKEFRYMIKRGVWRDIKRKNVPKDRRLIANKWVFKKKGNGVYRARLCALGYAQIAGVDRQDNFAPVIHETTFRLVMVYTLLKNWIAEIVDIETAFLYGDLEEEIYMEVPEGLNEVMGMKYEGEDALILVQSM